MTRHVRPGRNEFVIETRALCGLRILLRDGEVLVPLEDPLTIRIKNTDGDAAWESTSSDGAARAFYLAQPGRYDVVFGTLEGYQQIHDRAVTLLRAKTTELRVGLRRRP